MVAQEFVMPNRSAALAVPTRARWTQVAPTLLILWIVSTFDKSNISLVIADPAFLKEMNLGGQHALLGWLASGLYLAYGIAAPLWGWLIDRAGPRRAAILSLIIWALTCFASGLATTYSMLLVSRIVLGAGEAAMYPLTVALVAKWFPLKERGKATTSWWIGTMIGPMLVGLIITALIVTVGWRWQFHAMGILALILPLPMVWFLITDKPEASSAVNAAEAQLISSGSIENNDDAPGRILRGSGSIWMNYRFWLVVVAISSNSLFWWGWSTWLPTYLRTVRHFSFSNSGYLTFVIYGFAVVTILGVRQGIGQHLSSRSACRARLDSGRALPSRRRPGAEFYAQRGPHHRCVVLSASGNPVRRNRRAQRRRHRRHGKDPRCPRLCEFHGRRHVARVDRLYPVADWRVHGSVCRARSRRGYRRRLHVDSHQRWSLAVDRASTMR